MAKKYLKTDIEDTEHARLRLQLKYDQFKQQEFILMVVNSYVEHDPDFMTYIEKKIATKKAGMASRLKKKKKQEQIFQQNKELFALDENEIQNIFDIIASEDPDL